MERIGIGRSWQAIGGADTVLFLHDLTRRGEPAYEAQERLIAAQLPAGVPVLHVYTKSDLCTALPAERSAHAVLLSARSGAGLDALRAELLQRAGWQALPEGVFIARTRHVQALSRASEHLHNAHRHSEAGAAALELLAEELRLAHEALGEITGVFTPDDLLGEIFGRFCIGK